MPNLAKLPHLLDDKAAACRAVIETPKGSLAKIDYDAGLKLFTLKSMLPEGMSFPFDFGFVPSTLAQDGDPLDIMVMVDQPLFPGVVLDVRLVGVIEAEEHEHGKQERNDRLLAVAKTSRIYAEIQTPEDLPDQYIDHLTDFWINKDRLEGKDFRRLSVGGPPAAVALVRQTSRAAKKAA